MCDSIAPCPAGKPHDTVQPEFNAFLRTTHAALSMPPLDEVLFLFSAPQGYLAEIKRLDLPANTPKARICQWLWIQSVTVTTLQFLDMATSSRQHRSFKEALLWFDDAGGELRWHKGRTEQLVNEASKVLPAPLLQLVNLHLS